MPLWFLAAGRDPGYWARRHLGVKKHLLSKLPQPAFT